MEISYNNSQPSFGIKIYNKNNALTDIIEYADKHKKLPYLDGALANLSNVKGGDLLIIHGKSGNAIYSSFTIGRNTVRNEVKGCSSYQEASYNAILELVDRDCPKLMQLLRRKVKRKFNVKQMIEKYSA